MRVLLRHWPRAWQVVLVLTQAFLLPALPVVRRRVPPGPVRMRLALERLGGAWVKLGQMLALRFDLLPAAYCDELFKLLNEVKPFPYAQVSEIVRQELGAPPEQVFRAFAPEPFAAASIGQVHRAVLPGGQPVAVKVQRPRIRQILQTDIALMYATGRILDWTHLFGATRSRAVIDEFARWTADELDYLVEARQATQLSEQARGERLEKIARVYRAYTTSRVLTSELIEGIPLIDVLSAVRRRDEAYLAAFAAGGYDLRRLVLHLDWNMLNQVFVFGCFHADLHPANLYVLPGNAIGYVDFGAVGQLPDAVRESLTRYGWLLFRLDVEEAVRELMRWLAPTSASDAALARQQLVRIHQAFLYDLTAPPRTDRSPAPPGQDDGTGRTATNPYSRLAIDVLQTIRQQELSLSPGIVAYLKMLVTLGTLRHQLAPDYDLALHARRFFGRMIRQQGASWLDPRLAAGRVYGGTVRLRRAIEFVELLEAQAPLLTAAGGAYFGVRRGLAAARRRAIRLGVAAVAVGALLYVVLADPQTVRTVVSDRVPIDWLHWGLLAILLVLLASLFFQGRNISRTD